MTLIPEWLNEEAIKAGINFSQVLQDALMEKVGGKKLKKQIGVWKIADRGCCVEKSIV